jgi:hypothetical protein
MAWKDIGSEVWVKFHACSHVDSPSGALVRFGGEEEDDGFDRDDICVGAISWCKECRGPTWELISLEPLTVTPSVQTTCHLHPPHHGFITDGKWVPA